MSCPAAKYPTLLEIPYSTLVGIDHSPASSHDPMTFLIRQQLVSDIAQMSPTEVRAITQATIQLQKERDVPPAVPLLAPLQLSTFFLGAATGSLVTIAMVTAYLFSH